MVEISIKTPCIRVRERKTNPGGQVLEPPSLPTLLQSEFDVQRAFAKSCEVPSIEVYVGCLAWKASQRSREVPSRNSEV